MDGYKAILLWEKYITKGQRGALRLLLEYNKEDVLNLIQVEEILDQQLKEIQDRGTTVEIGASSRRIRGLIALPGADGRHPALSFPTAS